MKYYKGSYIIALYDQNDMIWNVFDNVIQMCCELGLEEKSLRSRLAIYFNDRRKNMKRPSGIKYNGNYYRIYFINMKHQIGGIDNWKTN